MSSSSAPDPPVPRAAAWAARAGRDVVLADAAVFPRDKTCGDGLTPRAIAELDLLGLATGCATHTVNQGLRAHGFGQTLAAALARRRRCPTTGSAGRRAPSSTTASAPTALNAGATGVEGAKAVDARLEGGRVAAVTFQRDGETFEIECERLVVADGVRSGPGQGARPRVAQGHRLRRGGPLLRRLHAGRTTRGSAATSSCAASAARRCSGYGWIFPLGGGQVNVGVGTLATTKRPADVAIKPLMAHYADERRDDFGAHRRAAAADERAAAHGRRREQRRRRQLGAHRRRRRLRQPAQRRGHRLRPRDRPARRRPPRHDLVDHLAGAAHATTTARRSPSPAGSRASSPCRRCWPRSARSACAATGS